MQDLTVDGIVALHAAIIARDGGDSRIISEANLLQMVFRANLITDPLSRAALILYSLAAFPAFREGNRRIGQELAFRVLAEGGNTIPEKHAAELGRLADGVAAFTVGPEDIEAWLAAHANKQG